jgi:DNA topoisomerase-1
MPPKFFKKKTYSKEEEDLSQYTNAKYLIIVESPSKCKKIEGFLGSQYKCIASIGHLREIEGLKSINVKGNFEITFSDTKEKASHIQFMRKVISKFQIENVLLATDDDREGEAIAWHICEIFNLPIETTKRIIFHEITKPAIVSAVGSPIQINMKLVKAQQARQVLDIIVGFKISPFLWKYIYSSKKSSLSAGRCQTPALRLIYDNQKERDGSNGIETEYRTTGHFFPNNLVFQLNHKFTESKEMSQFLELSKLHKHILSTGIQKESIRTPPKPFSTSKLLQTASNILNISPKQTMSLCQLLYQDGHITYMRTDSTKYSKDFLDKASKYISEKWKPNFLGVIDSLENKDSANPHEAIRVTNIEMSAINDKDGVISSLYKLIWKNTVESCMSNAVFKCTPIKITAPNDLHYQYSVEIPVCLGWKAVSEKNALESTSIQNRHASELFYLQSQEKSGEPINYNKIESTITAKYKHSHYTEASLIQELEKVGIGRPSTFSMLVETIQDRGYVKKVNLEGETIKCSEFLLENNVLETIERERIFGNENNKLVIQPIGTMCIEFLTKHFNELFSYDYTKTLEEKLDELCSPSTSTEWFEICKSCNNQIKDLIKPISKLEKQTYKVNDEYDLVFQQYGPVLKGKDSEGKVEYKSIKKDLKLDLEKIKAGKYSIDELIEIKKDYLGKYESNDVLIKSGQYGPYIQCGDIRESIQKIKKPIEQITLEDVLPLLNKNTEFEDISQNKIEAVASKNVLRIIDNDTSIRKGKFGAYVYYKTKEMKTPNFFNLKSFKKGFAVCNISELKDWLKTTYNIPN